MSDIIALKRRGLLDGYRRVVEIGAQQINDRLIASPLLDDAVALFGGTKPALTPVDAPQLTPHSPPGRLLWSALGLQSKSVDIAGADIRIDLNSGRVPWRYRGAFDLAINAGTTEHIANQGNAFAAIHGLMRTGGMMYHEVPAFGNIDHGFFCYQPKFFHPPGRGERLRNRPPRNDGPRGVRAAGISAQRSTAAPYPAGQAHSCDDPQNAA